ncbi:MAE_28990/MAE_18760 family HEPN-like nuclease [Streptococcus suis]|uniref:MAE_28990/MAE_18760 family HEPN-like nuclease n=1 Tax=Streptococcus suis TaxID=1307 RepID=UPI002117BFEF|nr:MAE_28990/MAE_18760 family HEPN-like nuclease [Streptococcus suis]MCQ8255809.1 MAE_28990/MAE_18760 family HEPN-like nuclease [Streptococcus suis]WQC93020.1 MAE_28990/MAE_18760 family HEPN-like nuclease [Streptococcus suis]
MDRIEYEKLKQEIDRFIDFLVHVEHSLIGFDSNGCQSFKVEVLDNDEANSVFKVMKSNATIMLYNLVEACVRLTMSDYYENFNNSRHSYAQTIEELKRLWVKHSTETFHPNNISRSVFEMIENVMDDEHKISLDFESFSLSGNADLREIKSILENHGIGYESEKFQSYGGALISIKKMRNSLAHGNISFEENGKKLTVGDISKYKNETYLCLEYFMEVVQNVTF